MAGLVEFIIGTLVEGYEFIRDVIFFIMNVFFLGSIVFEGSPILNIIPVAGAVLVIKFILRRGK